MPQGASLNSNAPAEMFGRVAKMQSKLHRWAAADPGRRFDELFNLVHDPATLMVAFTRVAGNRGAHTATVDGMTVADVEQRLGVPGSACSQQCAADSWPSYTAGVLQSTIAYRVDQPGRHLTRSAPELSVPEPLGKSSCHVPQADDHE